MNGDLLFLFTMFVLFLTLGLALGLTTHSNEETKLNAQLINSKKTFEILQKPQITRSGNFEDVVYYCPSPIPKTFQQMIAIDKTTESIISASNSFLTDELFIHTYDEPYEKRYGMYGGLLQSYDKIRTKPIDVSISTRTIMVSNSFTGTNSGHDLGTLLATLVYIRKNNLGELQLGIQELGFKFPRILEILELFYTNWLVLDFDVTYHFNSIDFLIVSPIFVIREYDKPDVIELISDIKNKSENYLINQGCIVPKNAKIVLIKQIHNTSARTHDAFYGAQFFSKISENGWIILNPEFDDMRYMICLLANASHIVVSYGAIMWTHMLFFNPEAKITHLEVDGEIAYDFVLYMKYFSKLKIIDTNLDSKENENLVEKINLLH